MKSALAGLLETEGHDASEPVLFGFVRVVSKDFEAEAAAYRPAHRGDGFVAEEVVRSQPSRARSFSGLQERCLPAEHIDPRCVAPEQQNTILERGPGAATNLRALLTDGPTLLAWFGVWRDSPFSRGEKRELEAAIPEIARRLLAERNRTVDTSLLVFESLGATLDLVPRPVFLLDEAGRLEFANAVGRALLEREPSILGDCAAAALAKGRSPRVRSVTALAGHGAEQHSLVVVEDSDARLALRLAAVERELALTVTEARVLAALVRGDANKDIAALTGSALRTVEVHVTAILKKCRKDSRTRLISWFWTDA